MSIPRLLRGLLVLLVATGVLSLYLGEFLGPLATGLFAAAVAASFWQDALGRRLRVGPAADRTLVAVAAGASAADLLVLSASLLDALVRLLAFLTLYKLFTLRTGRDLRTVAFLAFFMLVIAASSAFGVGFLFVFVVFVLLGTWVLLGIEVALESAPGPGASAAGHWRGTGRPRAALALAASAGVLAVTAGLFFVIPRVGLAALPLRARLGPLVTGFTERVELGAYGQIETDSTVVMRVHVPEGGPDPTRIPNLRWRGIVFDEFDGKAWTMHQPRRMATRTSLAGEFWIGTPRGAGRILRQEVYLEPIGTAVVFGAPRVLRLGLRTQAVNVDDMGSVSVPKPAARLAYTVDSEVEPPPGTPPRIAAPRLDPATADRYLQLPPLAERVRALARDVTAGSRDATEAALRLTRFLSREFRYTLALTRETTLDPVEEFLFVRRSGNCEYFAASLAVMLRSVDIPARVVGGFQRGEWNPYGRYFMVRLSDAHAWVEAHLPDAGWVTLDPSPRGAASAGPGAVSLYLDALRMRWYRYVINWSLRDQLSAALAVRRQALSLGPWLAEAREWRPAAASAVTVPVIAVAVAVLAAWRWRSRLRRSFAGAGRPRARLPRFYVQALRVLGRRGLRLGQGETAREFAGRVGRVAPASAAPFGRVTAEYERCRFGGGVLTGPEAAEVEACLATLGATPRQASGPEVQV